MSSNIGSQVFLDKTPSKEEAYDHAMTELEGTYRPEFLNRFNGRENIIAFNRLELDSILKIVNRELGLISEKYDNITLSANQLSISTFCEDQYKPERGARGLAGYLRANLEPALANLSLEHPDFKGLVTTNWDHNKQRFDISTKTN